MAEISLNPDTGPAPVKSIFNGNKGLMIAILIGIVAVTVGASALLAFNSANQYEGMIKKVETQTQQLKNSTGLTK